MNAESLSVCLNPELFEPFTSWSLFRARNSSLSINQKNSCNVTLPNQPVRCLQVSTVKIMVEATATNMKENENVDQTHIDGEHIRLAPILPGIYIYTYTHIFLCKKYLSILFGSWWLEKPCTKDPHPGSPVCLAHHQPPSVTWGSRAKGFTAWTFSNRVKTIF